MLLYTQVSCSLNGKNSNNPSIKIIKKWTEYKTKDLIPELLNLTLSRCTFKSHTGIAHLLEVIVKNLNSRKTNDIYL